MRLDVIQVRSHEPVHGQSEGLTIRALDGDRSRLGVGAHHARLDLFARRFVRPRTDFLGSGLGGPAGKGREGEGKGQRVAVHDE